MPEIAKPYRISFLPRKSPAVCTSRCMRWTYIAALGMALLAVVPMRAIEWTHFETAVRGYPVMRDANGHRIADGNFVQWIEKDGLHVQIDYAGANGRHIQETIVMQQRPELAQQSWQWRETDHGRAVRTFEMNLRDGTATAS